MKNRAAGLIIENKKILLFKRIRPGGTYYALPGGSIEKGERPEGAMIRELREELGISVTKYSFLFEIENEGRKEYYFSIEQFKGIPELTDPERERMTHDNQYHLSWVPLRKALELDTFYPNRARDMIKKLFA